MDNVNDDLVPPTLQVSAADRLQRFREDDQALAELAVKVHERAMGEGEGANAAAHTDLRIRERRACMWGYDAPQRTDMVLVAQTAQPSGHERMKQVIMEFASREQPERRAAIRRLDQLGPQRVLELLGPYEGDTDGTEPWPEDAALK
jgi:hypothetical protein